MANAVRIECEGAEFALLLEDDDRVVVAYLLQRDSIVGDVWLFNRGDTPEQPEWTERKKGPFKNASRFIAHPVMTPDMFSIQAKWIESDGDLKFVELRANGKLLAALSSGSKPGWCANAALTGPVARPLDDYIALRDRDAI